MAPVPIVLHVASQPQRATGSRCAFVIRNRLVEGGAETTCLTSVEGFPGPDATIRSVGVVTFRLARGTVRVRVRIVMRFAADGTHARQTTSGTIIGGTGAYRGARGRLTGGGTVVDRASGLGPVRLTYRLAFA